MILSEEQRKSYEEVVRPLIKWLNDNSILTLWPLQIVAVPS